MTPWQLTDLDEIGLTEMEVRASSYWVDEGGRYAGADGVARAFTAMGWPWAAVALLMGLPVLKPAAARAYALLARNRNRLPGPTARCGPA